MASTSHLKSRSLLFLLNLPLTLQWLEFRLVPRPHHLPSVVDVRLCLRRGTRLPDAQKA
ncbi:hypothetical protein DACRYDRAFT_22575 [Dacryopinax primogenitus]|uniref:Uncharacterized protein n=1 Tax=Dacryopinax primogenitus (strain DJM 731) TaxID=1858805 RepID=M5FZW3_DACPD|nr:uncharacterized protein DACRYDRAFT_22575 [Dacryopinax primogenitus]EJU01435.1 hypothetical protein DACRYDRAFT_22575 [Dacryopinax primogenitus]